VRRRRRSAQQQDLFHRENQQDIFIGQSSLRLLLQRPVDFPIQQATRVRIYTPGKAQRRPTEKTAEGEAATVARPHAEQVTQQSLSGEGLGGAQQLRESCQSVVKTPSLNTSCVYLSLVLPSSDSSHNRRARSRDLPPRGGPKICSLRPCDRRGESKKKTPDKNLTSCIRLGPGRAYDMTRWRSTSAGRRER
jgi:hypothetical protein